MLDLNITLVFQLVNFFIALYVLNLLLIRPIREIIRKRKAVMDDMSGESESYEYQAEQRLSDYDNQLTRARQARTAKRPAKPAPPNRPAWWLKPRSAPRKSLPRPVATCRPKPMLP